jgi:hypothetical protein
MAVVNSEQEAENLRHLFLNYGPTKKQRVWWETTFDYVTDGTSSQPEETTQVIWETSTAGTTQQPTPPPPPNATVHIGFHDLFIEGEYLSVQGK